MGRSLEEVHLGGCQVKIVFLISSRAMAGMELRAARVARLALARGHEMHFGCPEGSQLDRLLESYGVHRFPLYIRGSADLATCLRLVRYLRSHGIDLVMPFSGKDYWMTTLAGRLAGVPVLINRSTSNSVNPLSIPVMKQAWGVVAVSQGIKDVLTAQGFSEDFIQVVHLGVNTGVFSPGRYDPREKLRARYELPQDAFIVGSLARTGKGQKILLEVDDLLTEFHDRLHYFFAGEYLPERLGPLVEAKESLRGRVTLSGLVAYERVPEYLKALDLVVMLPEREPFSNSVIEAMAMEKPVIVSRTLGNLEAVEDGVSGLLAERTDRRALAALVRELLRSPQRAAAMGEAAALRVQRLFTEEVMMSRMEEIWQGALGGAR